MGLLSNLFSGITWYKVFDSENDAVKNIPLNKAVTVLAGKHKICMARTPQGYFAVSDTCPHNGASLSKGMCNTLGEIVCPWHNYTFDLKLGHCSTDNAYGVEVYKVDIRNDGLYIGVR
ncbi:MAG: nitrite reductase (NAD(P)H) small subunit [Cytophagales bacterium]|nr:nitrite reductase (NAD(P)H) small subunit [Cytophagales bacterium]